ncbi:MAG: NUDIX hydrolase [Lachnospiraceae bacterium]|nr:NUDIX hydrolase [Lachnospiraceae bacterium]
MVKYKLSEEEKEFLKTYDIAAFDRPSVTADIAVFAVMDEMDSEGGNAGAGTVNYRKDPVRELQILLVKRASHPFQNCWALPGGFSAKGESCDETALRELREETGVSDAYLRPFGVFSKPGRDPRGWIISHGYLALIDGGKYRIHAGTDAWEAAWFRLGVESREVSRRSDNDETTIQIEHVLTFYQRERELKILAKVLEKKRFSKLHGYSEFEILEADGLAFDHAEIILKAFQSLRSEAESTGRVVFDLMPELFTLNRLQRAFELVLGRELLTANFRRKMAPLVLETEEETAGVGHRPAKLFQRNPEEFYM